MSWIIVHVANSGSPILINTEEMTQIGIGGREDYTNIHRSDGGEVEVRTSLKEFATFLNAKGIEKWEKKQSNQSVGPTKKPVDVEKVDFESKSQKKGIPSKEI